MRRKIFAILVSVLAVIIFVAGFQQFRNSQGPVLGPRTENALRIASYNVHYILMNQSGGRWSMDAWETRKEPLDATFKALDADIVAFQEMESFAGGNGDDVNLARSWLLHNNSDYAAAAIGDWRKFPSTQPIFYRTDRFAKIDQGWFFFSETPDVIYSRTYDGSYPAFASWVDFRDNQNGMEFRVLNIHLDYSSRENRNKSVALISQQIEAWQAEGVKVLLLGDLNARLGSSLHTSLEELDLTFAPIVGSTYHLDRGVNLFGAIDHIAYSQEFTAIGEPVVFREKLGQLWPTDHYPVVVDFRH